MKLKVPGWKETPVQVHVCEFCCIFKNNYVVLHVRTAASDILGYPYVEICSASPHWRNAQFSPAFVFIHFKLILESCKNLRGVFKTISNIYDKAFSRFIIAETLLYRYLAKF